MGRAREGEHAVHIGAGVGYYTAVIARLVGNAGTVTAIEYEPDLAQRAAINLSAYPTVKVVVGDGSTAPLDPADVIYVNAGTTRPAETWLNALKDGGRLILPLTTSFTTDDGHSMTGGAIFLIKRRNDDYLARRMSDTRYGTSFWREIRSFRRSVAGWLQERKAGTRSLGRPKWLHFRGALLGPHAAQLSRRLSRTIEFRLRDDRVLMLAFRPCRPTRENRLWEKSGRVGF